MDPISFIDTLLPAPYRIEPVRPFVTLLGLFMVAFFVLGFLNSIRKYFLRGGKNLKKYGEYGKA